MGETFEITKIRGESSAASIYNRGVASDLRLQPGYLILSVNDVSGDSKRMWSEWRNKDAVKCEVCQPLRFPIRIDKSGPLGIDVIHSHRDVGVSLVLDGIVEGPFTQWNEKHPGSRVQRLDRIVAVDGVQ